MPDVHLQALLPAPPRAVWEVFTHHEGWVDWAGVQEVVLRQRGDPAPDGLGAIRVIRSRGIAVEEEITAFKPPELLRYQLVGGLPVQSYEAEVTLAPSEQGTQLSWHVRFAPRFPFPAFLLRRLIRSALEGILERLARYLSQTS